MKIELKKPSELKLNTGQIPDVPKNPRFIKDERFEKLKKSIQDDPQMLELREVIAYDFDGKLVVIAGNMRLRACKELGIKEIPTKILPTKTPAEKLRTYIVKDNVSFGNDDFDLLANQWDAVELEDWGLEVWQDLEEVDYSDKNQEINVDEMESDMVIKLKYTEMDYNKVKEQLSKIAQTPEQAVWKLLNNG